MISKEELIYKIEEARDKLNRSIDTEQDSSTVYKRSVELDQLIELYSSRVLGTRHIWRR